VRLGHVTDFIDLRWWPAFNLADSFIVIGVVVLLGALMYAEREPRRRRLDPNGFSGRASGASSPTLPASSRDAPSRPS
jgi:signal peptidase II